MYVFAVTVRSRCPDELADARPRNAAQVQERDSPVPPVVRRPRRDALGLARPGLESLTLQAPRGGTQPSPGPPRGRTSCASVADHAAHGHDIPARELSTSGRMWAQILVFVVIFFIAVAFFWVMIDAAGAAVVGVAKRVDRALEEDRAARRSRPRA